MVGTDNLLRSGSSVFVINVLLTRVPLQHRLKQPHFVSKIIEFLSKVGAWEECLTKVSCTYGRCFLFDTISWTDMSRNLETAYLSSSYVSRFSPAGVHISTFISALPLINCTTYPVLLSLSKIQSWRATSSTSASGNPRNTIILRPNSTSQPNSGFQKLPQCYLRVTESPVEVLASFHKC